MATFLLSPRARDDVLAIVDYIALDDATAANRWIDQLD